MPNGAKNWCFTEFDTSDEKRKELLKIPHDYVCFQLEQCPDTKKNHFQGFIAFPTRTTLAKAKKLFGKSHLEIARSVQAAIDYCQKADSRIDGPWEDGSRPRSGRIDLDDARIRIMGHERWGDVLNDEQLTDIIARYYKWARDIFEHRRRDIPVPDLSLQWQQDLLEELTGEAHPRKILWYWSEEGGTGKSTFARYTAAKLGALVITRGGGDDIIHAYENHRIVVFDYPRSTDPQYIHWNLLEEFKNGITFSKKYNSHQKIFNSPHVLVFSNINPTDYLYKLSDDRWKIKKI